MKELLQDTLVMNTRLADLSHTGENDQEPQSFEFEHKETMR